MSVTVSATSLALYGVMLAISAAANTIADNAANRKITEKALSTTLQDSVTKAISTNNVKEILQDYQTPFTDSEILEKTLLEHGCENFVKNGDLGFSCEIENLKIAFTRPDTTSTYKMKISCLEGTDCKEKIDDLNDEYRMNVQEETYIKLTERLEKNNMKIESEKLLNDDSIMLTINLE